MSEHHDHLRRMARQAANEDEDALLWALAEIERLRDKEMNLTAACDAKERIEEELRAEIERLNAERAGDQQRLFHYEHKLLEDGKLLTEAAAFLDRMAGDLWPLTAHDRYAMLEQAAADCRAMAARLRASDEDPSAARK